MVADLSTKIAGVELASPLVLASGVLGTTASSMAMVARAGAGAVTMKSCSVLPRSGNVGPCVMHWRCGVINAVGLSNPGAAGAAAEIRAYHERHMAPAPLFASVFGGTEDEFAQVAQVVAQACPALIEINVSCPNVSSEFGTPFGADPAACERITRAVKAVAGAIPVAVKLTVNAPSLTAVAEACAAGGADAITAINTVGPGMVIDVEARRPVLGNRVGGLSGPAILPIAVRAVYQVAEAVALPIIATGGVRCAADALQMVLAGATAIGVGSAVGEHGVEVFARINDDLVLWLREHDLDSLAQIRGAAHDT